MADTRAGGGLQTIFAIFLGLMVTAFVGVGVYTFYPSPETRYQDEILRLSRESQSLTLGRSTESLPDSDREQLRSLTYELNRVQDESRAAGRVWGRRTSMILVAVATLAMGVSLLRAAQLPVVSNGLLLGGVFTTVYGVGWIIATDTTRARFAVLTVALAVTIVLGYVRFARREAAPAGSAPPGTASVGDLERRLAALEQRMTEAAAALGRGATGTRGE